MNRAFFQSIHKNVYFSARWQTLLNFHNYAERIPPKILKNGGIMVFYCMEPFTKKHTFL